MVSQKYRGSCIGAALAKWLAKNTVTSQKMALEEKMEDGALEMLQESIVDIKKKKRKRTEKKGVGGGSHISEFFQTKQSACMTS